MTLYSYIIQHDTGGAPNADDGILSLAICKPGIRKGAVVGDYLVGISGCNLKLHSNIKQIIFIAKITEIMLMKDYAIQYPKRQDSIYSEELELLPNKFHNCCNVESDLKGINVLLSDDFIYFGTKHIDVPTELTGIIPGRQYKKNASYMDIFLTKFREYKNNHGIGKIGKYNQTD